MAGDKTALFSFSQIYGINPAGVGQGQPVTIEMIPSNKTKDLNLVVKAVSSEKEFETADKLYYRVPDVVDIRISQGNETLCTARKLVYQFGNRVTLPANFIIGK